VCERGFFVASSNLSNEPQSNQGTRVGHFSFAFRTWVVPRILMG
jgi:hypothetical protein